MSEPYLSVVVTARNDDHGGNLLGRMQAFVNGWMNQTRRYGLDSELIIVEWNPPAGRPRLAEALRWPADPGPCAVRIIEVPPELHARYPHGTALPLYQMIGKNVGIRRARGRFVLATNIDILFSAELVQFLAERRLDPNRMYRIDRHDVMADVPVDGSPEEQQAYCETHLIRVNRREGTFPADFEPGQARREEPTAPGERVASAPPTAPAARALPFSPFEEGLRCGDGWYPPEKHADGEIFCWGQPAAELLVKRAPRPGAALIIDVEPGPGTGGEPVDLEVTIEGRPVARFPLARRSILRVRADWSAARRVAFTARNDIAPLARDPRALAFRVFAARWKPTLGGTPARATVTLRPHSLWKRAAAVRRSVNLLLARMEAEAPVATVSVLVTPALRRLLRGYLALTSIPLLESGKAAPAPAQGRKQELPPPAMLHTNACGDFTLAARDQWIDLRGYAEFDLYSMNLDSLFCYAAHCAGVWEEMLREPMRIYHIEHGSGSGWTPEGQQKLYARLAAAGLSFVDMDTVLEWGAHMQHLASPMIFNRENWGLGDCELRERAVPERVSGSPAAALLDEARKRAILRPLERCPGWRFGLDWDDPAPDAAARRRIWEEAARLGVTQPIEFRWHDGILLDLYLGNDLSRQLFVGGRADPNEFAFLDAYLRAGMTVVDAGANVGLYSLFAARRVGPAGTVLAFEPSSREFARLGRHLARNGAGNVRAFAAALSDAHGEAELRVSPADHEGQNTLGNFAHGEATPVAVERVPTRRLDEIAAEYGLTRLDLMKIDVEGAETLVLRGAEETLRRFRPVLLLEILGEALEAQGSSATELLDLLRSFGYEIYAFGPDGSPARAAGGELSDNILAAPAGLDLGWSGEQAP